MESCNVINFLTKDKSIDGDNSSFTILRQYSETPMDVDIIDKEIIFYISHLLLLNFYLTTHKRNKYPRALSSLKHTAFFSMQKSNEN